MEEKIYDRQVILASCREIVGPGCDQLLQSLWRFSILFEWFIVLS